MHEKLRILKAKMASAKRTEVAERETAADFEAFVRNEAKGVVAYVKAAKNMNTPPPIPQHIGHARVLKDLDEATTRKLHAAMAGALGYKVPADAKDLTLDTLKSLLSDVMRFGGVDKSIIFETVQPSSGWLW